MYKCMHCGKEYAFPLDNGVCPNGCDNRRLKEIYHDYFKEIIAKEIIAKGKAR